MTEQSQSAESGRRIGIMGGTFDPVHHGHLVCAEEARFQFQLDEVIFIPAGHPWQKDSVSSSEHRLRMTELAIASNPGFSVSRIEVDRSGPTYTLDTLLQLDASFPPSTKMFFISGADAIAEILTWKDPGQALEHAHFIAASRPEYELGELQDPRFEGKVSFMKIPALALSSTDIRRRVAEGRPIKYLVPSEVETYIESKGLYSR